VTIETTTHALGGRPIDRIGVPDAETFARDHLRTAVPAVIVPDADDPLTHGWRALADPAHVRDLLANEPLHVRNGSASELLLGVVAGEVAEVPYGAFVDHLHAQPDTPLVCSEFRTPAVLASLVPVPPFAQTDGDVDADRVSDLFLAPPTAVAHLHYDGDLRDVVMVQLFGRKRYVLIDPVHSAKVLPLTEPGVQRTSGVFLEHLSPEDLAAFLRYTDAYETTLEPGELLLMPAGWWHYVEYLDVSLSVNHRLGRNARLRTLAEQVPVPSVEWMALAQCYRDDTAVTPALTATWEAIVAALAVDDHDDPRARADRLERECLRLAMDLDLPAARRPATILDLERRARLTADAAPTEPEQPTMAQPPDVAPASITWTLDTPVCLPDGAQLLIPVTQSGVMLAQGDRLVALLPPDPEHPWTLPLLTRIARRPGLTVATLAVDIDADPDHVVAFLDAMAPDGWVAQAEG